MGRTVHLYSKTKKTSLMREGMSGTEGDSGMKTLEGREDVKVAALTGKLREGGKLSRQTRLWGSRLGVGECGWH